MATIEHFVEKLGNANFYSNFGSQHKGCSDVNSMCAHMRAPDLFAESINSRGFVANKLEIKRNRCTNKTLNPTLS